MMTDIDSFRQQVNETVSFLDERITARPAILLVLGTGLGSLADAMEVELALPYEKIPHFPRATVSSHAGNLLFGRLRGRDIAVLQGRFHYYEGYSARELTMPVRVLSLLGAETLLLTNAAGSLNPSHVPGSIMIIRDHINLIPENPLRGPNIDEWGPRFPDMSVPYDMHLIEIAQQSALHLQLAGTVTGVYAAIPGPSLETPAETRLLRHSGADAVGMSSVPEVIVARHAGMRVLGLSVIANVNDPDNFAPILLEDVISRARQAEPRLLALVEEILSRL